MTSHLHEIVSKVFSESFWRVLKVTLAPNFIKAHICLTNTPNKPLLI